MSEDYHDRARSNGQPAEPEPARPTVMAGPGAQDFEDHGDPNVILDSDGMPQIRVGPTPTVVLTAVGTDERGREWLTLTFRTAFGEQTYWIAPYGVPALTENMLQTTAGIMERVKAIHRPPGLALPRDN